MKHLYLYFLAASLACSSCSDSWLDLNPSTSVTTDQAFTTLDNAQTALNGIYRLASAHSYYGDNFFYFGDCRAVDVQARMSKGDGGRVSPYYEYTVKATDNFNSTLPWNQVYKVIRQANNLLEAIEEGKVVTADEQALNEIKAQALAMRGLALYDLVRVFAMPYAYDNGQSLGVPIVTTPTDPTSRPARNTVAECYTQIIKDLTDALSGLTKEKKDGCLNYWAVQGILSRVYLNKLDYPNAYKAATDVIENSKSLYQLYTKEEYPTVWGQEYTSESLFEFYFSLTEPSGGSGGEGAPMVYANESQVDWNNLILTEDFLNQYCIYLRNEVGIQQSTVRLYCTPLKTIVTHAHKNGLIPRDPFANVHVSGGTKEREFLTEEEIRRLMSHRFDDPTKTLVRDIFAFGCLEKPRDFDPFGQAGLSPLATI